MVARREIPPPLARFEAEGETTPGEKADEGDVRERLGVVVSGEGSIGSDDDGKGDEDVGREKRCV
jgi:hypothetical protein